LTDDPDLAHKRIGQGDNMAWGDRKLPPHWSDPMKGMGICHEAMKWLREQDDLDQPAQAWSVCDNGWWMFYYAAKRSEPGTRLRQALERIVNERTTWGDFLKKEPEKWLENACRAVSGLVLITAGKVGDAAFAAMPIHDTDSRDRASEAAAHAFVETQVRMLRELADLMRTRIPTVPAMPKVKKAKGE